MKVLKEPEALLEELKVLRPKLGSMVTHGEPELLLEESDCPQTLHQEEEFTPRQAGVVGGAGDLDPDPRTHAQRGRSQAHKRNYMSHLTGAASVCG